MSRESLLGEVARERKNLADRFYSIGGQPLRAKQRANGSPGRGQHEASCGIGLAFGTHERTAIFSRVQ